MDTNFVTNTASLKTTIADIRILNSNKIDAKKMLLDGKNILEYIEGNTPTVKHSQDTRETVTENDLWGQYIETKDDGTIIVHDDWVTNPNVANKSAWNESITKVEDNKAYVGNTFVANVQTDRIKDGTYMFDSCRDLILFSADLSSLTNGTYMFYRCDSLDFVTFTSDLPSLTNGERMFYLCSHLNSFSADLSSLLSGKNMFHGCSYLYSFYSDLPSLTNGDSMFSGCNQIHLFYSDLSSLVHGYRMFSSSGITTFSSDLPNLINGNEMFSGCIHLTSFRGDLSNLTNGFDMFYRCNLDAKSVMHIVDTIKDIPAELQLYMNGTLPCASQNSTTKKYTVSKGYKNNRDYIYTYNNPQPYTSTISSSKVGTLTLGINVTDNAETIQQQLEDFAKEATFDSWADLKQAFVDKGWTVTFQYGGTTTKITL